LGEKSVGKRIFLKAIIVYPSSSPVLLDSQLTRARGVPGLSIA
jgi:hypothetical protein